MQILNFHTTVLSVIFSVFFTFASADESSRSQYVDLIRNHPRAVQSHGDYTKGEIQIVLDPQEMAAIEEMSGRDVGVLMRDRYWIWVNDPCIFSNGKKGVYGRILTIKSLDSPYHGVAVIPMTTDGKIFLSCNFRHATRTWEMELPRGFLDSNETLEDAAKREAFEETGLIVDELVLLGEMPPDTGTMNSIVPIYMARVINKKTSTPTDSEAIEDVLCLSLSEIKQAFLKGYLELDIRGENTKIYFRDPFLAYAILKLVWTTN